MLSPSELHGDVRRANILTTFGFFQEEERMDASRQPVLPAMSPCIALVFMDQAWAVESDRSGFSS